MRNLDSIWKMCHSGEIPRGNWEYEREITINNGTPYKGDLIENVSIDKGLLYNNYSIGNTVSSKISFTILPHERQKLASGDLVKYRVRVSTLQNGESEWYAFGTFYVEDAEEQFNRWSVDALDALAKLEGIPIKKIYKGSWPVSDRVLISSIVSYLGINLDPRTKLRMENLGSESILQDQSEEIKARDALSYIGELNGGNWYITENNQLRLVQIGATTKAFAEVTKQNTKTIIRQEPLLVSKLKFSEFSLDMGGWHVSEYGTGSDDMDLVGNPWFDEAAAKYVLRLLERNIYYPYSITSTEIDPAIELGDTIKIEDDFVSLWQVEQNTRLYTNFSFPTSKANQTQKLNLSNDNTRNEQVDNNINDLVNRVDGIEDYIKDLEGRVEDLQGVAHCTLITDDMMSDDIYIGPEKGCAIIPTTSKGAPLTTAPKFRRMLPGELKSAGDNLIDASGMFKNAHSHLQSSLLNYYPNIQSVDISQINTSNVTNMSEMFMDARAYISGGRGLNTGEVTDMSRMFQGSLADTDVSSFYTSKVEDMSNMFNFYINYKLNSLNKGMRGDIFGLENFNTSEVLDMHGMFNYDYTDRRNPPMGIENWIVSKVEDMSSMFRMVDLETIGVLNWEAIKVLNMSKMFQGAKLNETLISELKTDLVTDMSEMFQGSVGYINPSNLIVSNVTKMNNMFSRAELSQNLNLSHWDTSKVENENSMFSYSAVENLNLSGWENTEVVDMGSMFKNLGALIVDLTGFKTPKVENMSYMFERLGVSILNLNSFDTSYVTNMSGMFRGAQLETINLESFTTPELISTVSMFEDTLLTDIDIRTFTSDKLTDITNMFLNTPFLERVYVNTQAEFNKFSNPITGVGQSVEFIIINENQEPEVNPLTDFTLTVNEEGFYEYKYNKQHSEIEVVNVVIPKAITDNENLSLNGMFSNLVANELIVKFEDESNSLNSISGMFVSMYNVSKVNLSNLTTTNVENMSKLFAKSNISEIIGLDSINTSNVIDMSDMFYSTTNLENLDVSFNTSKVLYMDRMFSDCSAEIITGLNIFDTSMVISMYEMFSSSSAFTLDLSSFVSTSLVDSAHIFANAQVTQLDLSNFDTNNVGSNLFSSDSKLISGYARTQDDATLLSAMLYTETLNPEHAQNVFTVKA